MDIRLLDFGRDTAEFDDQLKDYFITTPAYEDIIEGHKSLVIGRKGSGKTSIMRYCIENEDIASQYVIKVEATHATYSRISEKLNTLTYSIQNLDSSFKLAWLATTLMRLLDRFVGESLIALSREERLLYDAAVKIFGYDRADPISVIAGYVFDWFRNLKKVGSVEREFPDNAPEKIFYDETRLLSLIQNAVARANSKGKKVYIFYDKLDERWDGTELHTAFIQGLFLATKDVKSMGLKVFPVVLLRDDIFRIVSRNFQHIDHYRMEIAKISWDENSLIDLVAQRIRASLASQGGRSLAESSIDLWNLAFPAQFKERKHVLTSYTYMIERTLFRPRDIILLCNMMRDRARLDRVETLDAESVKLCEKEYSSIKRYDLVAEYSYLYPGLESVLLKFKEKTIGFDIEELRYLILEIQEVLDYDNALKKLEEDNLLRILFDVGFLCYTKKGGVLRGTQVVHSGVNSDTDQILKQDRIFVSPIFRKGLDLKDH